MITILLAIMQTAPAPTMSDEASFVAWATAIGAIIAAVSGAAATLLTIWFTKGKDYSIAMKREDQKLNQQQIELKRLDADELTRAYEGLLEQVKAECGAKISGLENHVQLLDRKLQECEEKHIEILRIAERLAGKLEVIENRQGETRAAIDTIKKKASDSGLNLGGNGG